ncbi:MAG TPA: hypothetical protein VLW84_13130 [Terriglobales bacterium]|nr:hypothetical protein [Terriglobales bacterium]
MKKRTVGLFATLAVLLMLSSPSPAAGHHPHIEEAIQALHSAKGDLESAAHDFGGHRADAIRAIDEAEKQLKICMAY